MRDAVAERELQSYLDCGTLLSRRTRDWLARRLCAGKLRAPDVDVVFRGMNVQPERFEAATGLSLSSMTSPATGSFVVVPNGEASTAAWTTDFAVAAGFALCGNPGFVAVLLTARAADNSGKFVDAASLCAQFVIEEREREVIALGPVVACRVEFEEGPSR